jgi:hypothetical protein
MTYPERPSLSRRQSRAIFRRPGESRHHVRRNRARRNECADKRK